MKLRNLLAIGISLVLAGLLSSCAQETISIGKIIDKINSHMKSELQLTPEQSAKLTDVTDTLKQSVAEGNQERQERSAEWLALIEAPQLDQAKIREMAQASAAESAKNTDAWLDRYLPKMAAFHDSLTPAQLKKASAYFQKLLSRFTP